MLTTRPGAGATVAPPEDFAVVLPAPAVNELVDPADLRVGDGAKEPADEPGEVDVDFDGEGAEVDARPAELGDDEPEEDEDEPEADGSAHATPCPVATASPTPKATANAPTRPT